MCFHTTDIFYNRIVVIASKKIEVRIYAPLIFIENLNYFARAFATAVWYAEIFIVHPALSVSS